MKRKYGQNSIIKTQFAFTYDKNGNPVMMNVKVETTDKKVIVYRGDEKIGEAGVINARDFDFDVLFRLATTKLGKKIDVA